MAAWQSLDSLRRRPMAASSVRCSGSTTIASVASAPGIPIIGAGRVRGPCTSIGTTRSPSARPAGTPRVPRTMRGTRGVPAGRADGDLV